MTTSGVFFLLFLLMIDRALPNPTTVAVTKQNETQVSAKVEKSNNTNHTGEEIDDEGWEYENSTYVDTRRILYSKRVPVGKRPYMVRLNDGKSKLVQDSLKNLRGPMVYLQLTKESAKIHKYRGWLCGGVIVHPYYVLTSAACVEDADHFYIVSGTTKFVDSFDYKTDDCVCKRRRRVVWKCIPKNYKFDFQDSIKWSSNDIAIVKVDKPFKLGVIEGGCEFATDLVCYNNVSRELEKAGTKGYIAGWGSGNNFREGVYRRQNVHIPTNAKYLQEAKVCVMDNEQCAKKWAQRFRSIITQYMICTKDVMKRISEICDKKYANCTDVEARRKEKHDNDSHLRIDVGRHLRDPDDYTARRTTKQGGFCENDHGGPLIVKYQGKERVIGVISACKIDPKTHSCHGPFLYTSVFMNRQFLSCAINKDVEENCRRVFRTGITHEEWNVQWDDVEEDDDAPDKASLEKRDKAEDSDEEHKDILRKEKEAKKESESFSNSDSKEDLTKSSKKNEKKLKEKQNSKTHTKTKRHTKEKKKDGSLRGHEEVFYESSKDENVNEPGKE